MGAGLQRGARTMLLMDPAIGSRLSSPGLPAVP